MTLRAILGIFKTVWESDFWLRIYVSKFGILGVEIEEPTSQVARDLFLRSMNLRALALSTDLCI